MGSKPSQDSDVYMTMLVDFHCHLDLFPNPRVAIDKAELSKIQTLTVTTTPRAWPHNKELTKDKTYVRAALGYHPELIKESATELSLWEAYLPEAKYIGEVGLDGRPEARRFLPEQKMAFGRILDCCAKAGGRILSVHSTFAVNETLDLIERHLPLNRGKVVLHWFTGTNEDAIRAAKLDCFFSINSAMLSSARSSRVVKRLPIDRIITETDGPFIFANDNQQSPVDVELTVKNLAHLLKIDFKEAKQKIHSNLIALLSQNA